ncbi:PAS domain-containing response regulator [Natrarchaeobius chitinivorans]|uniref:PAS domain S-box protein n=1 Tax=Natrarchaeobius chitinivorans TaxID=1679083 RepID=A0A3N6MYU6_NATCH|nr:PAS domain S-box protein [Natrarchaeobius chitinivorans]RQG90752.1 PAS domain S-box protein [Natrarchaeobius chitinivorans]
MFRDEDFDDLTEFALSAQTEPIQVLLVDDDQQLLNLTETFLERISNQIQVIKETDVNSGVEAVENRELDCVVSDYDMPKSNGLDFLKQIREDYSDLPFILFTGKGSEEIASDAISAGVTDYLQKGGGKDKYTVLANQIENLVGKYRAEQEVYRGFKAMNSAQEGIGILNDSGEYVYLNQSYAEIYNTKPEQLLGEHWEQLYPEEEAEKFRNDILPILKKTGVWKGEAVGLSKDGERVPEEVAMTQLENGGHVCVIRDLTEEKKREKELRHEKQFLDAALNSLDHLFYVFDSDLNYVRWNDRLIEVTGYSEEEMKDISPLDLFEGETEEKIEELIYKIIEDEEVVNVEAELVTKQDEKILYDFTGSPIKSDGEVIGVCGLGRRSSQDS